MPTRLHAANTDMLPLIAVVVPNLARTGGIGPSTNIDPLPEVIDAFPEIIEPHDDDAAVNAVI